MTPTTTTLILAILLNIVMRPIKKRNPLMRIEYKCWGEIILKSVFVLLMLFIVCAGSHSFLSIITAGFLIARPLYSSLSPACIPLILMKTWHLTREQGWELLGPSATLPPCWPKQFKVLTNNCSEATFLDWPGVTQPRLEVFIFHSTQLTHSVSQLCYITERLACSRLSGGSCQDWQCNG